MGFLIQSRRSLAKRYDDNDDETLKPILESEAAQMITEKEEVTPNDNILKFLFCVGGIYASYLVYGTLQEDVFTFSSKASSLSGSPKFLFVWIVQVLEALVNTLFAIAGYSIQIQSSGQYDTRKKHLPVKQLYFFYSGMSQVMSKAFTSLSLAHGLSFPVATMAKSAKMAPVMIGQLILGESKYYLRDYMQVLAIIVGTGVVGMSKDNNSDPSQSTFLGAFFILFSLVMDGITGGYQKGIKRDAQRSNQPVNGFLFMAYTNFYMTIVALFVSLINRDLINGAQYIRQDPEIVALILKFCFCSAVGQTFIFFAISIFDPLVVSTITTTRKIVSVLLSVFYRGHHLNHQGWCGIILAFGGIASELKDKCYRHLHKRKERKKEDIESQ